MKQFSLISVAMGMAGIWLCATSCQEGENMDEPEYQAEASEVRASAVTRTEAMDVAAAFSTGRFGKTGKPMSRGLQSVETITGADGKPVAYVVNTDGAGWVIVSATKDYHPILAYSDDAKSTFHLDGNERNTGVAVWMDEVSTAIAESSSLDSLTTAAIAMEWAEYTPETQSMIGGGTTGLPGGNSEEAVKCRERLKVLNETYYLDGWSFTTLPNVTKVTIPSSVYTMADWCGSPYEYTIVGVKTDTEQTLIGPLSTTTWNQRDNYNALCPDNAVAGCVAIAMAQIMYYHKYPAKYDWNNMLPNTATYATQYLIADIGENVDMDYGALASYSSIYKAQKAFKAYGYKAEIKGHEDNDVESNIRVKRPVYMDGRDLTLDEGHSWMCDGMDGKFTQYRYYVEYLNSAKEYVNYGETLLENPGYCGEYKSKSLFHMNWGWKKYYDFSTDTYKSYDGWYLLAKPGNYDLTSSRLNLYVYPN